MRVKLGYYPVLDMALALRQIYSGERFKPFINSLEGIHSKMNEDELAAIQDIGDHTVEWLSIIEKLIKVTLNETSSIEEILVRIRKAPEILFGDYIDCKEAASKLSKLWENYFSMEISKNSKLVYEKVLEISEEIDKAGAIPYIGSVSDRVEQRGTDKLRFLIKPDHEVRIRDIQNIIVMPSIFASRNLTFWYDGLDYIFYISANAQQQAIEPSDMLMLRTAALNDKTRLKMLRMLSSKNYNAGDMAEKLDVNSSTVSRHFKLFKDTGFVDIYSQDGNSIYYALDKGEIKKALDKIFDYIVKGEDSYGKKD